MAPTLFLQAENFICKKLLCTASASSGYYTYIQLLHQQYTLEIRLKSLHLDTPRYGFFIMNDIHIMHSNDTHDII